MSSCHRSSGCGKNHTHHESVGYVEPKLKDPGFLHERVGFEVVTLDGRKSLLASSTVSSPESMRWPIVGKYKVDVASFDSISSMKLARWKCLVNPSFRLGIQHSSSCFHSDLPAVARLKNQPGVTVITLTASNRDSMKQHIFDVLSGWLPKH